MTETVNKTINAFGHTIEPINEILSDGEVYSLARDVLRHIASLVSRYSHVELVENLLNALRTKEFEPDDEACQGLAREVMGGDAGFQAIKDIRTEDIIKTLNRCAGSPEIRPQGHVLDLGCGHGRVAKGLVQKYSSIDKVDFADVVDYRNGSGCVEPFTLLPTQGQLPFSDKAFDDVLLVTVLHHSENPHELLSEAVRVCRRRLFIMESLVCVTPDMRTGEQTWENSTPDYHELERRFCDLSFRQQIMHAAFEDWFYNSVIQGDVNVPMNFGQNSDWAGLFKQLGTKISTQKFVGYDQRTAPEYHAVYVIDVKN